jgi:nucleotide-binding universal stress UspA family protein
MATERAAGGKYLLPDARIYATGRRTPGMTRRVLVAIDGSPHADAALEYACTSLADPEITALFVLDPFGYYEAGFGGVEDVDEWFATLESHADALFAASERRARDLGVEIDTAVVRGRPDRAIIEHAVEHGFDGIVLGAHGRNEHERVLLGTVAENVTRRAPVPVTVVR